jgi:uncharacterized membrane protein
LNVVRRDDDSVGSKTTIQNQVFGMGLRFFISRILIALENKFNTLARKSFGHQNFSKKQNLHNKKNLITKKNITNNFIGRILNVIVVLLFQTGSTVKTVCCQSPRVDS